MSTKKTTAVVKATATAPTATAKKPSVMLDLASQLNCDPRKLLDILKTTCFRACKKDEEFQTACMVAREYKLNPLTKEIYAFPSQNGVVPIVAIDGWIRITNSHPKYDGVEFEYGGSVAGDGEGDLWCKAKIYRKDRVKPICVTEFYEECYRSSDPWNTMPRRMLRWKAFIQCARVAFGFAGIYDFDEGNDILAHDGKRVTKDGDIIDAEIAPLARESDMVFEDEPDPTESDTDEMTSDASDEDGEVINNDDNDVDNSTDEVW